jgi:hypothetical protein
MDRSDFKRERRLRKFVATELRSRRHIQLRYGKGDWKNPSAPVCFAHVVKRTLHKVGEKHSTCSNGENRGTRDALGLDSGDYNRLVQMNDKGVPFSIIADVLEAMPYKRNKNSRRRYVIS